MAATPRERLHALGEHSQHWIRAEGNRRRDHQQHRVPQVKTGASAGFQCSSDAYRTCPQRVSGGQPHRVGSDKRGIQQQDGEQRTHRWAYMLV